MNKVVRTLPVGQALDSGVRRPPPERRGLELTAEAIVSRLEAAGAALLAMPSSGYSTHLRQMKFDILHSALEAYGWQSAAARPPVPSASDISLMDEAFGWLVLIPEAKYVLRRLVGGRALVHPITERHVYTWRRLAAMLGTDHKSAQRWHGQAIEMIRLRLLTGV